MSVVTVLGWVAFAYVLLQGIRYLLGARVFLTCALREVETRPVERHHLDPGELRLLSLLDDELAAAGFRHLGFGEVTALITYYDKPLAVSIFENEQLPAYALVRRALAPEYGRLVELEIRTGLASGEQIVTLNTPFSNSFLIPRLQVAAAPGSSVQDLVAQHRERVASDPVGSVAGSTGKTSLDSVLAQIGADLRQVRSTLRARKRVVPTANPSLDRFTLRGAFAQTRYSRQVFGGRSRPVSRTEPLPAAQSVESRQTPVRQSETASTTQSGIANAPSDGERSLRVEADLQAVLHVAENPETAPGTSWPLLTLIGATAVLSFIAMAWLWDPDVAAMILAAIAFHEGGHAMAMRWLGYRDVHIFFVPLVGAMTIARPAVTTVRDRLVVLLAGPLPGLWLGVALLVLDQAYGPIGLLRGAALALLLLNGLNLLPFTPLDGGRALEALTRPESRWRAAAHGASAAGLLVLAVFLKDPAIAALGFGWAVLLPRQLLAYRLSRDVAAGVKDRADFRSVVRAALEVMTQPRYARWRAATRQVTARALGRTFSESLATPADHRWGALAYASAWIPVVAALLLWTRR
jgi:Zn-dependent protease